MTFDQLQQQSWLSEQELKEHLVVLLLRFYKCLYVDDPEIILVKDCSQFYGQYYKGSSRG